MFCNILSKQVENDVARLTTHELFLSSDKSGCCTLQKELIQNRIDSGFTDLNFATKSVHDSQEKLVLQQVTRVSRNFIQTEVGIIASSGTQGQSVGSGKKARRKFSSTGEKAPGYRLSPNYFQNFKPMPAPNWAQKMLCIIVPNRRTVFPEFFS